MSNENKDVVYKKPSERLSESLRQYKNGETITFEEMQEQLKEDE